MTIADWIIDGSAQLANAGITSPRLDAELILSHTLRKSRTYLHAHMDDALSSRDHDIADARLLLRLDRTPLAYILGHKDFYGRRFRVTPATLIPRPESEAMITMLKESVAQSRLPLGEPAPVLVDVGTGSGCLGITAKLELPGLDVTLIDNSRHALTVAEANAKFLQADVRILQSDLLANFPFRADYILANLPYVDESWELPPEIAHEPRHALFAPEHGLGIIFNLLETVAGHITPSGLVLVEADIRQHTAVTKKAVACGFRLYKQYGLVLCFSSKN